MEKLTDHQVGLENANLRLINEISRCEEQCNQYKVTIDGLNGRLASLTADFDIYRRDNDTEKDQLKMQLREAISNGDLEHELNHAQAQLRSRDQGNSMQNCSIFMLSIDLALRVWSTK